MTYLCSVWCCAYTRDHVIILGNCRSHTTVFVPFPFHAVSRCTMLKWWNFITFPQALNLWKFSQRVDYGQSVIFILSIYIAAIPNAGIFAHSLLHRLSTLKGPLSGDTDSSSIAAKSQWNQRRLLWRCWSQKIGWLDSRRWPVMASFSAQGHNTWSQGRE